jgi:methylisocitrate lyase
VPLNADFKDLFAVEPDMLHTTVLAAVGTGIAGPSTGADCLYAPRLDSADEVAAVVEAVAPKPVNLLINAPFITVAEAAALAVRRISVGGTLARAAWGGWLDVARQIATTGTFTGFTELPDVDGLLAERAALG